MRRNPFLESFNTLHDTIPFNEISIEDFEQAMMKGIEEEDREIQDIVDNEEVPTFKNTMERLERSGALLGLVSEVFYSLLSAETSDAMEELAQKMSPLLTEHANNISLNEKLFKRVEYVYQHKEEGLTPEQLTLLNNSYDGFVRSGVKLPEEDKKRYRELTTRLGLLTLRFSQNKLKDMNDFLLVIKDEKDLEGIPENVVHSARCLAEEKGVENGWCFNLQAPSYVPFMTYCPDGELRKRMYMAYNTVCTHDNEYNNFEVVREIVNIRHEIARLLGFGTYADYKLVKRMACKAENVYSLLNQLLVSYKAKAQEEVAEVEKLAKELEGDSFEMMPWDFSYYSNKLKEKLYNINSELLRPYFELENVKKGVFELANRLYGIEFRRNEGIQVYHPDVEAYDVLDADGRFLAVLYCDFYPRESKKSGAWMTDFKGQWKDDEGNDYRPHVSIVMNFTKPTPGKPSLLTLSEVETFLHEFGHSLHGMFADTVYQSLSGTNTLWDFVELPSQFMENYSIEKEFLNTFAFHYLTGEPLPDNLIKSIVDSRNFNVAYACMRQVSFGLLDMAFYSLKGLLEGDIRNFEREAWKDASVLPVVDEACMSVQFSHIMAGGYSAGYYSYKWAEVLDADTFSLFKENGIFNRDVAARFRSELLSRGGTEHPSLLYKRFRGKEPSIDALLKRNGII